MDHRKATMPKKLSEPQQSLVSKLRSGARLSHSTMTGLFRLKDGPIERTIHPATVQSLIEVGVLNKGLSGDCRLTQ